MLNAKSMTSGTLTIIEKLGGDMNKSADIFAVVLYAVMAFCIGFWFLGVCNWF